MCVDPAVLVLYDFALTTGDEVRLFWNRKLTGATVLFWLNKWLNVLLFVCAVSGYFKMSDAVRATSTFAVDIT